MRDPLAVGPPRPPALLAGALRASLFHPGAFQQVLVAWLDFGAGMNRRERENLAAGMGRGAQGIIKSMLMTYTHTHSHSKLILFCFLDSSPSHSRKVARLYFLASGALAWWKAGVSRR